MGDGVNGFGPQVLVRARQRLTEPGILVHEFEQLIDGVAMAVQQVLEAREIQAVLSGHFVAAVPQREEAGRADERNAIGARGRHRLVESAGRFIDGLSGHDAVRRELAARDHHQAGSGPADGVLARQLRRRLGGASQQRTEPGVDADHVRTVERLVEERVDVVEQVIDVPRRSRWESSR